MLMITMLVEDDGWRMVVMLVDDVDDRNAGGR
jgi:hypothetical protein